MPLYYFDVQSGSGFSEDEDGAEFSDLAAVEEEAKASVIELIGFILSDSVDTVAVAVRDEGGNHVLTATATVTVRRSSVSQRK